MIRLAQLATLLAVIAVPALGWFTQGWSGATTLVVYWFETALGCALIAVRISLHQRWTPRRGHFRYAAPTNGGTGARGSTFCGGFVITTSVFTAAHGLLLAFILVMLNRTGAGDFAEIVWRQVLQGCLCVAALLVLDTVIDLATLRRWPFWQIEQTAQRGLSRIVVVHLTLVFGMAGAAFTGAPSALFSVFVVLKTLAALSAVLPQYQPAKPPAWLSRFLNRIPNSHPGERFEDFWAKDRADEHARRERNEQPWP
ncbi:MAG: DUF6498-containing protein [Actinomycetota bacterium]